MKKLKKNVETNLKNKKRLNKKVFFTNKTKNVFLRCRPPGRSWVFLDAPGRSWTLLDASAETLRPVNSTAESAAAAVSPPRRALC